MTFSHKHKRTLLLVFIHGFLGSEDSFHQFPRHIHDALTVTLAETYDVVTKIYPRYKSRGSLKVTRNDFSNWLSPHESTAVDIILLGHSLGGILAADVALMFETENFDLKHRILGLVNFDVPFLGIHPRVISTGIKNLFSFKSKANAVQHSGLDTTFGVQRHATDTKFNPTFSNDAKGSQLKGWESACHFLFKHSSELSRAILQYGFSHYDHVGCLNNYPALLERHAKLYQLEKLDGSHHEFGQAGEQVRRVRWVNYYTVVDNSTAFSSSFSGSGKLSTKEMEDQIYEKSPSTTQSTLKTLSSIPSEHWDSAGIEKNNRDIVYESGNAHNESHTTRTPGRKFCLPPRAKKAHLWMPVRMDAADEVLAHQSIFFPGLPHYEWLVRDTVARIEGWLPDLVTHSPIPFQPETARAREMVDF